ncbi:MAG TPA: UDP-glucose/GDP-mannose dehydrogenase family protein [Bacteroidetes bacterium]|nr:UDP-glucose/GDP-mannose dehydrogenase family protein [Bacteroidota bacterium]
MKITVVGTGYVGLVTGTCFADTGVQVHCIDIDERKVKQLNEGKSPIYEPGLEPMIQRNMEKGRLFFSTDLKPSLEESEVIFIAVGTPPDEDGSADLQHVLKVASQVGKYMTDYMVVVTKSTVPVGTARLVKKTIKETLENRGKDISFDVVSNPEFLKEGNAVQDFLKPDRIVIGVDSEKAKTVMRRLYKPFLLNNHPILFMDIPSAEMTKYTANAMLATKISFMNEIANLCERVGASVEMVRKGIGSDPRIGNKFIYPGTGYGGSCFPKDVKALIKTARDNHYQLKILEAVEDVNEHQKSVLFSKISKHFKDKLKGKTFGIWGLSFKPLTDDIREAPSLVLIGKLLEAGANIKAYDPAAINQAKRVLGNKITYSQDPYDTLVNADALVLVTEWPEFRLPNFRVISKLLNQKVIFDGRNIFDPAELKEHGFTYYGIGIGKNNSH